MDGTREELIESLKVDVNSVNLTNIPKPVSNGGSSGSTSGGVSGNIAGHGAESNPDRSFE